MKRADRFHFRLSRRSQVSAGAVAIFILCISAAAPTGATLLDLGTLGGDFSEPYALNSFGQVVGVASTSTGQYRAFLYSGGTMTDLGTLGGANSEAVAINNAGQIVGRAQTAADDYHAFFYSGGVMTDLGTLGGVNSATIAISDSGQILGQSQTAEGGVRPFLYSGGVMTALGTLGGEWTEAVAINDSGLITGRAANSHGLAHAFLYDGVVMTDLGTLGGRYSGGHALNGSGQVVGWSAAPRGRPYHAFLYTGGVMIDLGTLGGYASEATAINAAGEVVGWAQTQRGPSHGFLYSGGVMTDLGALDGEVSGAVGINASGQVLGSAFISGFSTRAFLYSAGILTDLGTLGGEESWAVAINDSGYVVGQAQTPVGEYHAFLRIPACGDGIKDVAEDCDDGNTANGDCCASDCMYGGPASTCLAGTNSTLSITNRSRDANDRLRWRWNGDGTVVQPDLGDPSSATTYTLCISDSSGGVDSLVALLPIGPSANWTSRDPDGWSYEDGSDGQAGVFKARLTTGAAGSAEMEIRARGAKIPVPTPVSATELFDQDGRVTVQLFNDATSTCWTSEFTSARMNSAARFKSP